MVSAIRDIAQHKVCMSPVSSVFYTEVTVNIGLKNTVSVVASIPSIRCLCYKPKRFRLSLSLPPTHFTSVRQYNNNNYKITKSILVVGKI